MINPKPVVFATLSLMLGPVAMLVMPGTAVAQVGAVDQQAQAVEHYIKFYEWHFELRLNPEQRQRFRELIIEDNNRNRLGNALTEKSDFMTAFAQKNWMELYSLHSDMKNIDTIEQATEDSTNGRGSEEYIDPLIELYTGKKAAPHAEGNSKIYGNGTAAMVRRAAKDGARSAQFLLDAVRDYQKPILGDGSFSTSLFNRDIDATFEWMAVRSVMVAGKRVVQGDDQERAAFKQNVISSWNAVKDNPEQLGRYRDWLKSNVTDWLMWRGADYSFFARQTPFGQKEQLARWGAEIAALSPAMKPYADQRMREYRDYVAKMPDAEIKREYELKQRTDTEFKIRMQKMQNDMKSTAQTFAVMRQGLLGLHVANLNIAENIGNSGFRWEVRTQP